MFDLILVEGTTKFDVSNGLDLFDLELFHPAWFVSMHRFVQLLKDTEISARW